MRKYIPYICAGAMMLAVLFGGFYEADMSKGADMMQLGVLACAGGLAWGMGAFRKREKEQHAQAKLIEPAGSVLFSDVAGSEEAVACMAQMVEYLKHPERFDAAGARMPRGVLLYGPPGTGKTLLARAVAGEAGVPFIAAAGSDFVQMYAGIGAKRIRELFERARKFERAVVFIDEIDAVGKRRGFGEENGEREQTLNALLAQMSGFHEQSRTLVIAATNRVEVLDEALTRPGRFDRRVEVGLPDAKAREKIIAYLLKRIHASADAAGLAKKTTGFSGAGLESLVNEAAIAAASRGGQVTDQLLDQAYIESLAGKTKESTALGPAQRHRVAVHEAGHAMACYFFTPAEPIVRVSILPSVRGAGGYVVRQGAEGLHTRRSLLGAIRVALAGRAAEEIRFGLEEISVGAANDLMQASEIVRKLAGEFALEPGFGLLVGRQVDEERLNDILEREYAVVFNTLLANRAPLERFVAALENCEQMNGEEATAVLDSLLKTPAQFAEKAEALP